MDGPTRWHAPSAPGRARAGVLFQCSIEEAEELRIGMAGFTSYAETVSVYGTEAAFVDGDDTPWSKAFLTAAYASRGIKARCTSGAWAELLMGFHERQSVLYLEARCLCLQRAMGVQGTQNGGIDGAPLTVSMAGGMRELMAENLIAVWLGLECASGNDTRVSESEIRVGAKITPLAHGRLGPAVLGLRIDPQIRQLLQPLALQRRRDRGLPRTAARFRS